MLLEIIIWAAYLMAGLLILISISLMKDGQDPK